MNVQKKNRITIYVYGEIIIIIIVRQSANQN